MTRVFGDRIECTRSASLLDAILSILSAIALSLSILSLLSNSSLCAASAINLLISIDLALRRSNKKSKTGSRRQATTQIENIAGTVMSRSVICFNSDNDKLDRKLDLR